MNKIKYSNFREFRNLTKEVSKKIEEIFANNNFDHVGRPAYGVAFRIFRYQLFRSWYFRHVETKILLEVRYDGKKVRVCPLSFARNRNDEDVRYKAAEMKVKLSKQVAVSGVHN